jgi:hypothetical protein
MRALIVTGFCLAWATVVAGAFAEDIAWRPATSGSSQSTTGAMQAASWSEASRAENGAWNSTVTLSKPEPLSGSGSISNTAVTPISYNTVPVFRAKAADDLRMPSGPSIIVSDDKPPPTEDIPVQPKLVPKAQPLGAQPFGDGGVTTLFENDCCECAPADCCGNSCSNSCGDSCGACCNDACGCCDCCMPRPHIWLTMEYLLWAAKAANAPPLLTTGSGSMPGVLPPGFTTGTTILFDSNTMANGIRSGGRLTLGFWLPWWDEQIGFEANYLFLGQVTNHSFVSSTVTPPLSRPFTNAITGANSIIPVAGAGLGPGAFTVNSSSYLWGAGFNTRAKLCCGPCGWLDGLIGYRHLQLQDSVDMFDLETMGSGALTTSILTRDSFFTRNQFNGVNLGLDGEWHFWGRWFVGATAQVALGNIRQVIEISGANNSLLTIPGVTGILASNTNSGTFSRDRFGVVPELTLKLGYDLTDHLRVFVGYDLLYINNVVRAGDQIDLTLNPSRVFGGTAGTGPLRPAVPFKNTDFWVQGANFGLELRY